jgi:iron complex transport system ATP-binding protein
MLLAQGLDCSRGGRTVLSEVTLGLEAGQVLGVLGANGAGKSSLLATLSGEIAPSAGQVSFDGRPLSDWTTKALARRRAVLPQTPSLAFDLDVRVVVEMGAYAFPELAPREVAALVTRALRFADAVAFLDRRYGALSGGEQQRVQFARVLVQLLAGKPPGEYRVLFLDEPTASLDPRHQMDLLAAASSLAREEGVAVLVVLHDVNLAAAWCDRLLLLADRRVVACGSPAEVLTSSYLLQVYAVEANVMPHPVTAGQPLVVFSRPPA